MAEQYATLKDVAKRAGTTAATVSYVLNNSKKRYISEEMRRRVEEAARDLHYVKSSAASSLRGKKRKIIAVLVPQFQNQLFTQIMLSIENVADSFGYILSICNTFDDPEREAEIIDRMQAQRVDGYIITPTARGGENTRQIRQMGVPLVVVDRSLDIDEEYFWVSSQNYESIQLAMDQFLQCGHRRIAYIGWNADFGGLQMRQKAYRDALEAAGIPEEDGIIYNGQFTEEDGARLTEQALREHPDATALLYAYNIQARGGVQYLAKNHILPGKDISVIIVGSPDWARTGSNDFTCVDLGGIGLGRMAAEMLFRIIESEKPIRPHTRIQSCSLMEGSSVYKL
ncbi:LacI family DNA-binding transcriptional regulator [Marasmitruncus massiliensis]|uniref:LacI family DNA-binding transcriptional regulator n=1 Tax=Marasmitruncus massiliensis TaxID=1944642 RepID=UPI000C7ABD1C|nr:LacI family DNA-binding transcriptional regulator [Marasmitruncus massiliensis]